MKRRMVIELEEELYNYMQTEEYDEHLDKRFDFQIRFAIKNGTLLPKEPCEERKVNETSSVTKPEYEHTCTFWNTPCEAYDHGYCCAHGKPVCEIDEPCREESNEEFEDYNYCVL